MATKSVKGKGRFTFDQLQEVERATEMRVLEQQRQAEHKAKRPLLSINGNYLIAPDTTSIDMANDVGCLLESARTAIDIVIDGLSEDGSQMTANASVQVPRLLFGVLYQLEMVGNLVGAMRTFPESPTPEHLS